MGFCHWASEHMCAVVPDSLNPRGPPSWAALCSFLRLLLKGCLCPRVAASEALRRAGQLGSEAPGRGAGTCWGGLCVQA